MLKNIQTIIIKFSLLLIIINITPTLFTQNSSKTDQQTEKDKLKNAMSDAEYNPEEDLKRLMVTFDMGGGLSTKSRILFTTFQITEEGFNPLPDDRWMMAMDGTIWARMNIFKESFLHIGIRALFYAQKNDFGFRYNSLVALFNLDEIYFQWKYPIGKVVIGRTNFFLKSSLVFNGPLDGLELDIKVPYLNFKTFVGYTGLLGLFNPIFNPYSVNSLDRSFEEESNLLFAQMVLKFNEKQARRLFFATDFDIYFFGQHINPYFLLQYDLASLSYNFNTDYDINTFHLGLNLEGRIIQNFYYKAHISGAFGTFPSSTSGIIKPLYACALETKLRYTFSVKSYPTFILGYALGTGNEEAAAEWSNDPLDAGKGFWADKYDGESQNKYIYYGKYDGGFVLNPILSNIHSISFRFILTPYDKDATTVTLYLAVFQTLKLYDTGPISDEEADLTDYIVGTEINTGINANLGAHFNLSADYGLYIPETAYSDTTLRHKLGISFSVTF